MKQRLSRALPFALFPAIALGTGWLSSTLTRYGLENVYPTLLKSALTPPGYVFPIAWTILYVLMGISMALVWNKSSQDRVPTLRLWACFVETCPGPATPRCAERNVSCTTDSLTRRRRLSD